MTTLFEKHGGVVVDRASIATTHIFAEHSSPELKQILDQHEYLQQVHPDWVFACDQAGRLVVEDRFDLVGVPKPAAYQIDRLDSQRKLFLFDFNGTLGVKRGKALRPGISTLKKLQVAGYAIGIWSNAQLKNLPIT